MNGSPAVSGGRGFDFALRFAVLFAAAHVVLVFGQSNFLPISGGWNIVWLSLELLLGIGAFFIASGCLLFSARHRTASFQSFETLYRDVRSPGLLLLL